VNEASEKILNDCSRTNRICPQPIKWGELWELLPGRKQKPSGGWGPALPLILAAWWEAGNCAKHQRFKEHLSWAESKGVIDKVEDFLDNLSEEDWFHEGD